MGVIATDSDVRLNVEPLVIAWPAARAPENRKLPALTASQELMWLTVTEPPSQDAQEGVPVIALDPPAEAPHVTAFRTPAFDPVQGEVVPAAPGSAVWSPTYEPGGAVNAVPPSMSSHLFARVVPAIPVVI
jgi:hypothetical protein